MTKKTDSLIFRYGVQTLWKNTNFLFKTSLSNSFFFKFFQFELQQRNFELLTIEQKKYNLISVFIFCFFWKSIFTTSEKNKSRLLFKTLLFYKYWFLFKALFSFFFLVLSQRVIILNFNILLYFSKLDFFSIGKRDYTYPVNIKNLYSLYFKIEQIRLESMLSLFFGSSFNIRLHNVFNSPLYFDFIQLPAFINTKKYSEFTTIEFILYLSCKLRMISIFTRYLAKSLALEKRHRKVLWAAVNAVKLLSIKLPLFKGIRIYVKGKLNGKMRRKTYSFKFGRLALHQISSSLDYFKATSFTKFGTLSVKVWVFF